MPFAMGFKDFDDRRRSRDRRTAIGCAMAWIDEGRRIGFVVRGATGCGRRTKTRARR
jgi:hypothetical protein